MELAWFITAFDQAAKFCRDFAQPFVVEALPRSLRFNFTAAQRTPDQNGRIKFLGGRLLSPEELVAVEPIRARKYLWVDGKVPQWINLTVEAADDDHTYIEVRVCDRLASSMEHLYHTREGSPPFHILSPALPPEWESVEKNGKFSLTWRVNHPTEG